MLTSQLWELGTAPSGSDGDTARVAGEKYNLHQHPGQQFDDPAVFDEWKEDPIRVIGDIAVYKGVSYVWNGVEVVPLGIGPIAVSGTKIEEIVLCTRFDVAEIPPEVPGDDPPTQVVAADFFSGLEYKFARWNTDFKFRVVGTCVNTSPDYSAHISLRNTSTGLSLGTAAFVGIDQANEVIVDVALPDARHLYEVVITCVNCDFVLYKAAIRAEHTVVESV